MVESWGQMSDTQRLPRTFLISSNRASKRSAGPIRPVTGTEAKRSASISALRMDERPEKGGQPLGQNSVFRPRGWSLVGEKKQGTGEQSRARPSTVGQGQGGAQGGSMRGLQGQRWRREMEGIAGVALSVRRSIRPGCTCQVRIDGLPIVAPQLRAATQRHQPAIVGESANAAEIVIAAETGRLRLMEETEQDAPLTACGRKPIEPGQMVAAGGGQHRFRRPPDQRACRQPSLHGVSVHAQPKSIFGNNYSPFVKRV